MQNFGANDIFDWNWLYSQLNLNINAKLESFLTVEEAMAVGDSIYMMHFSGTGLDYGEAGDIKIILSLVEKGYLDPVPNKTLLQKIQITLFPTPLLAQKLLQ